MNKSLALATLLAVQLSATHSTAHAQQARRAAAPAPAQPSWYIGGGLGNASIPEPFDSGSFDDGRVAASSSLEHKRSHALAKAFVGFNLNRYFAIEGGYNDLGRFGGERRYVTPDGSLSVLWTVRGFNLDLVGTLPITDALGLQARIGAAHLKSDLNASQDSVQVIDRATSKWAFHMGMGVQYHINSMFAIRGDYDIYKKATNTNVISWSDGREIQYQTISASAIVKF